MTKPDFKKIFTAIRTSLYKHSPEILTGIGVAGMVTTTVLAVRATPKALKLMELEKQRQNQELLNKAEKNNTDHCPQISKLKPVDVVKTTWKCYVPSAIIGTASIACLIGASSVHLKRNAVLATAYKLSESALTEYKEKVVETIGEKKERAIRDQIDKDRIKKNPISNCEVIVTQNGETMCYDHYSKRYFKSSLETIKMAAVTVSRKLLLESYVSLNEFYYEIGLPGTDYGEEVGWNTDKVKIIDVRHSAWLDENQKPCLAIDFEIPPTYEFDKFY